MRVLIFLACMATFSLFAQDNIHGDLFKVQLENSCNANLRIIKSVTDMNKTSQQTETKSYAVETGEACLLQDETIHAFILYHGANRIKDYYEVTQQGDTLVATLLPGKENASSLLFQKILLSSDGKTLLYVESKINREYWLFTSASHIQVTFDEKGLYQSHEVETRTDVAVIGDGVNVWIKGEREN